MPARRVEDRFGAWWDAYICVNVTAVRDRLGGWRVRDKDALMRVRFPAGLAVVILLMAGCTDMQASDGGSAGEADPLAADISAASEAGRAAASERASEPDAESSGRSAGPEESSEPAAGEKRPADEKGLAAVDKNDSGADVKALQKKLAKLGFAPGPVDGAYGPKTAAAVESFQMLSDLKQTGRADAATVAALDDYDYDGRVLEAGDTGADVKRMQKRLDDAPFDPGPADGQYGGKTVQAVWALEKLAGVPVDGNWGPLDEYALQQVTSGAAGGPDRKHEKRWVEIDLSQQLMKVYDPGSATPHLVSHASSGSGVPWSNEGHSGTSITPKGDFEISRRISGWRESSLDIGRLYNPLYFNGGIALHGAMSVPLYPASHGCVRLPMHIADYLPGELPNGTPVHVLP